MIDYEDRQNRALACAVINRAVLDMVKNSSSSSVHGDAYLFLTGRSPMSSFWFKAADISFLTGTPESLLLFLKRNYKKGRRI